MKIRLLKPWQMSAAGDELDPPAPVAKLLIDRDYAIALDGGSDPDDDGKAEGGADGIKKAFSSPPATKPKRR